MIELFSLWSVNYIIFPYLNDVRFHLQSLNPILWPRQLYSEIVTSRGLIDFAIISWEFLVSAGSMELVGCALTTPIKKCWNHVLTSNLMQFFCVLVEMILVLSPVQGRLLNTLWTLPTHLRRMVQRQSTSVRLWQGDSSGNRRDWRRKLSTRKGNLSTDT